MPSKALPFIGSGVALITPFKNNVIDFACLEQLIELHITCKTSALIVLGTTGESPTVSDSERTEIIKFVVSKVHKRIPVIVGTGSNCTDRAVLLSREAESLGADALLLVSPFYNKTSQRGLVCHYNAIACNTDLPCILYNVPSRTGIGIKLETFEELSKTPNIVAVKEASGDFDMAASIIRNCGDDLYVYSGCDELNVPLMLNGAKGFISVLANIVPDITCKMADACMNGCTEEANQLKIKFEKLTKALFMEVNPIPIKYAMKRMGLCSGELRLPLVELDPDGALYMEATLSDYHLI